LTVPIRDGQNRHICCHCGVCWYADSSPLYHDKVVTDVCSQCGQDLRAGRIDTKPTAQQYTKADWKEP
jgi:hypothetical protein